MHFAFLIGFVSSIRVMYPCSEAREIFNKIPTGPIHSMEDGLSRWSELHRAIDRVSITYACFRQSHFVDRLLGSASIKIPKALADFDEYLWRQDHQFICFRRQDESFAHSKNGYTLVRSRSRSDALEPYDKIRKRQNSNISV